MNGLTTFVLEIGWVAKTVLLILLMLSVISWGIIIEKIRQFIHECTTRREGA